MKISDFQKWLRQGLGRAAAYIRNEDPAQYRDALLHACTHNLCYDRQCEETRGQYLADLVQLSADKKFFRDGVLTALTSQSEEFGPGDVMQMFGVARNWAAEGDEMVRQTLYDVFARDAFGRAEMWCGHYLVKMEGLDALLFVVQLFGRIEESDRLWQFEMLVTELEERDGKEAAAEALATAAAGRPDLAQLLEMLRAVESRRTQARQEWCAMPRRDYASVKRGIMGQERRVNSLMNWGKEATAEELQSAAEDSLSESDEKRLLDYLSIFKRRRFPGPHKRLIELAKYGSWRLSHAAVNALTHIDDPSLRTLGLELMSTPDRCDLGVTLLTARSQPGDYQLIEQALRQPMSDHVYHSVGMDVLGFVKANLNGEAEASLTLLYENGPCSMCRESCVKHLIALNRLPEWMRQECRYDADSDTRELVAARTEPG
jgi:hypothetical protein